MKKVKIFQGDYQLEEKINEWIEKNNVQIISIGTSTSCSGHGTTHFITTILYEDALNIKI